MESEEKEVEEEDYDFDFSIYEEEDKQEEVLQSIKKWKRPLVSGLRSRISNGQAELERMADINILITKYSILIASQTQDSAILWKYYGVLDEFWESFRNIWGSLVNDEVTQIKNHCRKLLQEHENKRMPYKVHNNLLFLRHVIYRLKNTCNLGFEVEKKMRTTQSRARDSIAQ